MSYMSELDIKRQEERYAKFDEDWQKGEEMMSDATKHGRLQRSIRFEAAYDKRDPDPSKNYGVHGVTIRFVVSGDEGATQFLLYTGWQLPHVEKEWSERSDLPQSLRQPMPADLGFHSKTPHYEDHTPMKDCEWTGGDCYYDGSSLNADPVFKRLLEEGEDGVWATLEDYYADVFKVEVHEEATP